MIYKSINLINLINPSIAEIAIVFLKIQASEQDPVVLKIT